MHSSRFLAGGDDMETNQRRNGTVKLIPRISQGSWFVKQSVGTTPCLLGRKLTTRYFRFVCCLLYDGNCITALPMLARAALHEPTLLSA